MLRLYTRSIQLEGPRLQEKQSCRVRAVLLFFGVHGDETAGQARVIWRGGNKGVCGPLLSTCELSHSIWLDSSLVSMVFKFVWDSRSKTFCNNFSLMLHPVFIKAWHMACTAHHRRVPCPAYATRALCIVGFLAPAFTVTDTKSCIPG